MIRVTVRSLNASAKKRLQEKSIGFNKLRYCCSRRFVDFISTCLHFTDSKISFGQQTKQPICCGTLYANKSWLFVDKMLHTELTFRLCILCQYYYVERNNLLCWFFSLLWSIMVLHLILYHFFNRWFSPGVRIIVMSISKPKLSRKMKEFLLSAYKTRFLQISDNFRLTQFLNWGFDDINSSYICSNLRT